jgi:hypothetical protein
MYFSNARNGQQHIKNIQRPNCRLFYARSHHDATIGHVVAMVSNNGNKELLKKLRLLRRFALRGKLLATIKDTFPRHCERFEESRGNLKRHDGTFSTASQGHLFEVNKQNKSSFR